MNIVWFTWKDKTHPDAGGAELISSEIQKRLSLDGHRVTVLTSMYPGAQEKERIDGYDVIRSGSRYSVYVTSALYYIKNLRNSTDFIVEEINTIPFMTQLYAKKKRALMIYQLCREIWFHQMGFPLNIIGYVIEPLYLFLLRKNWVITESKSTKKDLLKYGFYRSRIHIIPIFTNLQAPTKLKKKFAKPTILSLGSVRSMKRTLDQIHAFEMVKKHLPEVRFILAGDYSSKYGKKVIAYAKKIRYREDINILGSVSKAKKRLLLQKSHILLATSIKEGWGLTVTEAASQGTPTIGYNVDGIRDSIQSAKGMLTGENVHNLADTIVNFFQTNDNIEADKIIATTAKLTVASTYRSFEKICKKIQKSR